LAEFVIASIKGLGLQPPSESRLMQMYRVITSACGIIAPDALEFETALEAERDFQVLGFVLDVEAAHAADPRFREMLRVVVKDSVLPNQDRGQSKGRDTQFELFVAAVCKNAHMLPVAREEPDVTCHVDGIKFGIAAKRLKSLSKLEQRIREAANQIEGSRIPGFIALETNVALNRDNERITKPIPGEQFGQLYKLAMDRFVTDHHARIQEWVRRKGVRGIQIHDQQVRQKPDGQWSLDGMTERVNTARENSRRNREYALFDRRYWTGLPNV